jgi:hypothetical protein
VRNGYLGAISDVHPAMLGKGGWILNGGSFASVRSNPRRFVPRPTVRKLGLFYLPDDIIVPT